MVSIEIDLLQTVVVQWVLDGLKSFRATVAIHTDRLCVEWVSTPFHFDREARCFDSKPAALTANQGMKHTRESMVATQSIRVEPRVCEAGVMCGVG